MFPCAECAKAIIQSGIKEIIFVVDKYETTDSVISSKLMLFGANVKLFNLTTVNGECSKNFYTIKNFLSNKEVFNKVKKSEVYVSDNFQSVLKDLEIFNRQ